MARDANRAAQLAEYRDIPKMNLLEAFEASDLDDFGIPTREVTQNFNCPLISKMECGEWNAENAVHRPTERSRYLRKPFVCPGYK
jgi:hypothetical protein